jgi:hypothetical protein
MGNSIRSFIEAHGCSRPISTLTENNRAIGPCCSGAPRFTGPSPEMNLQPITMPNGREIPAGYHPSAFLRIATDPRGSSRVQRVVIEKQDLTLGARSTISAASLPTFPDLSQN